MENKTRFKNDIVLEKTFILPLRRILSGYLGVDQMELDLISVTRHGYNLEYVENQTEEICFSAVRQDGNALCFVTNQTLEICLTAVRQNGEALRFVYDQTQEICFAAVTQNIRALLYVTDNWKMLLSSVETIRNLSSANNP